MDIDRTEQGQQESALRQTGTAIIVHMSNERARTKVRVIPLK